MFDVVYASEADPVVVVCIPTLRRPAQLRRTLDSLMAQDFAGAFACVVADNDAADRAGAALAEELIRGGRFAGAAVVVREPGNCQACNGAFEAARALFPGAPFVAMIDDDEIAEPDWLRRLVEAQERSGADLVGGPVTPEFEAADVARYAAHPVFKPYYATSGQVAFLYGSGNVLMRAAVLDRIGQPYFDDAFNFVGGGDTDFFKRCRDAGFTSYFEAGARARETVAAERTTTRWVLARSLRYGAINYLIETKRAAGGLARVAIAVKTVALLGVGTLRGLRSLLRSGSWLAASHPVMEAVGRAAAQIGLKPEQYRHRPSDTA